MEENEIIYMRSIERNIASIKEIAKNHPIILRYLSWTLVFSMPVFLLIIYVETIGCSYNFITDFTCRITSEFPPYYRNLFKAITISSLLIVPYFLFKWLSNDNAERDAYGNYEGLNKDILELINNKENGYELELLDYIVKYRTRLLNHIKSLTKNSSLNLVIGLMTTIIGVLVLYKILIESSNLDMLGYLSRISIAIFIELSSFFFLRLYSANLFEIKYFHNELSNIDSKMIALKVSLLKKDDETLKFILKELMKTERNQLLKKGETTVELERMKFDREESKALTDTLTKIFEPLLKTVKRDSKDDDKEEK